MARILVMRYDKGKLPPKDITDEKKKELEEGIEKFLKDNDDVEFNGLWVNDDGVGICDWQAPDVDTVKEALDEMDLSYDDVIEVKKVLPE